MADAYKYIVDGCWILDPGNTQTKVVGDLTNSMIVLHTDSEAIKKISK